jgi:hypothetical protein
MVILNEVLVKRHRNFPTISKMFLRKVFPWTRTATASATAVYLSKTWKLTEYAVNLFRYHENHTLENILSKYFLIEAKRRMPKTASKYISCQLTSNSSRSSHKCQKTFLKMRNRTRALEMSFLQIAKIIN